MKLALVRGKFLNQFEVQSFVPLIEKYDITAFGSLTPFHDAFPFPTVKLPSPMDVPEFPYKMQILNRLFVDAHYLYGLEEKLKGFDIVHTAETYYHYTQQCLNAKKKGYVRKVVATVLENIPFNNEGIWGRKVFKKRSREELDHIIALTNLTKRTLITEGADPDKITVISHGIDTKRFKPNDIRQKEIRDHDTRYIRILYVGRLEEYKGVFELLESVQTLIHDTQLHEYFIRLSLYGNGSEKENILQKIKEYGIGEHCVVADVLYNDMPFVYGQAHIFVAPSKDTKTWSEQYNTSLLEAQASGLPIVSTKSGGIPENVGDAGILVEQGSVSQLTNALREFILSAKKRELYANKARSRAVQVHDVLHIARKLDSVYSNVLAQTSSHEDP